MPVAPTPPTKPTPPVPPTLTPTGSNASADTHTAAPANSTPNPGKTVNTEATGAVRQLEGLGRAFQGNSPPKTGEKPGTSDKPANQTQGIQATPAQSAGSGSQAEFSAETAVPAKPPLVESKSLGSGYYMFLVGIVAVVAIVLVGLRLFKNKRKNKQPRTSLDFSKRTTAAMNQEGIHIVGPQVAAPEGEKHFEVRV
ncbi:hypothetical protein [Sporomusa acidovorans]|uniref:Uncharacterized protein n=1 Tax=Sporomusa acidovorans (strain ATCC 49682 / DSM 3132 / Mol) TaxID=1123286 RepID=A0ABZ3J6R2_SPOA4|nr:hypothetical protein [Sporomusa acidovorans]OZC15408.1 hypothetical protein SPACI_49580 [Sporomusa acidovorans DSM 3132]SDF13192.1 hypothetical protein SAMN04488499_103415 [Sporomusa acidovorans]